MRDHDTRNIGIRMREGAAVGRLTPPDFWGTKPGHPGSATFLKRPGLDMGKVGILCGGPDWPTSVLTGLLKCKLSD